MVTAVAEGADEPWPASVVLEGEYGIAGVAVSVPVALAPGGVAHVHEWTLRADDLEALRASAELVRTALANLAEPH